MKNSSVTFNNNIFATNNILICGTPASGKTRMARLLSCLYLSKISSPNDYTDDLFWKINDDEILYIPVHQGCDYDGLIKGIDVDISENDIGYRLVERPFLNFCNSISNTKKRGVVIFDDINSINIDEYLGESFYAIENRNEKIHIRSGGYISIPDRILIIVTVTRAYNLESAVSFFNKFCVAELTSDGEVLDVLVKNKSITPESKEKYIYYKKLVEANIVDKKLIDELVIGHGLFIAQDKKELELRERYLVIPIIQQYIKDGLLELSYSTFDSYVKACDDNILSMTSNDVIKKYLKKIEKDTTEEEVNQTFDAIKKNLKSRTGISAALAFRYFFELTWLSGVLDSDTLLTRIYLNTDIVCLDNGTDKAAFLVKEGKADDFSYNNNEKHATASKYYSKIVKGIAEKQAGFVYKYNNNTYYLLSGFRDGGTVEFDSTKVFNCKNGKCAALTYIPFLSRLLMSYLIEYKKSVEGIVNGSKNTNLLKIIESDIKWLKEKKGKTIEISDIMNPKNMVIITAKAGDVVKKVIDGISVSAKMEVVKKMARTDYETIMRTMNIHQMVLQGPPGTSKTYGAKEFILKQIDSRFTLDENEKELNDHQITDDMYDDNWQPPAEGTDLFWDIVQFHPSYGYEDFVRGITVETNEENKIAYKTVDKILGKIVRIASKLKDNTPVYLIIDEINRANVSTTFGELIYALEYRDKQVNTPYTIGKSSKLALPNNLYIIGTMNTADKSIGNIDYAIRRRFIFFPMLPNENIIDSFVEKYGDDNNKPKYNKMLFKKVEKLFDTHLDDEYYKDDVQIGHTMFLAKNDEEMKYKFIYQVLPVLREYYKDRILVEGEDNIIMDYLTKYGKVDRIEEEALWRALTMTEESDNGEQG